MGKTYSIIPKAWRKDYKKMGVKPRRKFNTKTYHLDTYWSTKRDAELAAKHARETGSYARVVDCQITWPTESKKTKTHCVYSRKKPA